MRVTESFGQYARRCRKQARVSLYLLGKATQLAPAQIQAVERGEASPPGASVLTPWAAALNVPPAEFVARAGHEPHPNGADPTASS